MPATWARPGREVKQRVGVRVAGDRGEVCQGLRTSHAVQHVHAKFAVPFPRQRFQPPTQPAVVAHRLTKPGMAMPTSKGLFATRCCKASTFHPRAAHCSSSCRTRRWIRPSMPPSARREVARVLIASTRRSASARFIEGEANSRPSSHAVAGRSTHRESRPDGAMCGAPIAWPMRQLRRATIPSGPRS